MRDILPVEVISALDVALVFAVSLLFHLDGTNQGGVKPGPAL